ncbi:MAG: rhodanese-like domain-containing protein [Ruminococcus sp.]|nr:rhodanese-like domain-containing protein [Ruminococcus sp.]
MKQIFSGVILIMGILTATGCNEPTDTNTEKIDTIESVTEAADAYVQITHEEAKALMNNEENYIILDVRTAEEFNEAHIDGAILIPDYEISEKAAEILTDKNQLILVYCRSGRRSKLASAELAEMGYTNVKEFGGIIDWNYGTITE